MEPKRRECTLIGKLKAGYEYKMFNEGNFIRIVGVHPKRKPIVYVLDNAEQLVYFGEAEPDAPVVQGEGEPCNRAHW